MPTYGPEFEGRTAISKDGKTRIRIVNGEAVRDYNFVPAGARPGAKLDTSPEDMKALTAARDKASAERDALRTYAAAERAVDNFGPTGTGPVTSTFLDAIIPEEDGGMWDKAGAILGTPLRALTSQKTLDARDHLKTVNANVALAGSQQQKGTSSDKDTALLRLAGMGPAKTVAENKRILSQATEESGLAQARSLITADWISRYGSLSAPSSNGTTFETALQNTERNYQQRRAKRRLPTPPPSVRKGRVRTYDLDGNPLN